ncbi:MAG: hypothetical protein J6Z31_07160 [Fibrobacter sp.]|nr:hypothetical protein [Fibrobacter sp.]
MFPRPRFLLSICSVSLLCACGVEFDTRGAERLQFSYTTPPNIKSTYEVLLGNLEAKKYENIHGAVKHISQKNYVVAKDEYGNWMEPHFAGTVEIHHLPNGELADFASYDSTGSLTTLAQVIHKANRREIYVHTFDANRDFVYFLANDNRIIEESGTPFYRQSPVDNSWNSADGHLSWEENSKHQIVAASGSTPSVQYRHLYEYDANDSLVRILAMDQNGKRIGSIEREFTDSLLQKVEFRFDEHLFYPDLLNYTETYQYDSNGRLTRIITKHSKAWSPKNDTTLYVYRDSANFSERFIYRHGELESHSVYDAHGNATLIETYGSFIYEGSDGTAESYDMERLVREIEYYGDTAEAKTDSNILKQPFISLSADEFFRETKDSALYCIPSKNRVFCRTLNKVPGTLFLNFIESITYKNASEVFLEKNAAKPTTPLLISEGKCAMILNTSLEDNGILFTNSLVKMKRNPYAQFFGDTLSFSAKDFPCELK